jgi:glycosyltransferase involved in cell wall biosynthesis
VITINTAVFTIVSKNYLSFSRTLLSSVQNHHPEWDRFVLLADEIDNKFDPKNESFHLINLSEIKLPDINKFLFRYTILELNTAVKPWVFSWLFNEKKYDKVIYIDPDIYVYSPLTEVERALDSGKLMVLTPHLTGFLDDDKRPSELNILQAGTYNLGFLAVSKHHDTERFLKWWQSKLEFNCTVDIPNALFVDQKWMDLTPGFFEDVYILHHPGYNVAYWNLKHRTVTKNGESYFVNGKRLVFFHFSGINPSNPNTLSKHQNRFTLKNIGAAAQLVQEYADAVLSHGHEETKKWSYYYGSFHDGVKISDFLRIAYRNNEKIQNICGDNPFKSSQYFLNTQAREQDASTSLPLITHIMYSLWLARPDLQHVFPDLWDRDRVAFCQWFIDSAQREYDFTDDYVQPVKLSLSREIALKNEDRNNMDETRSDLKVARLKTKIMRKLYNVSLRLKPLVIKIAPPSTKDQLKKLKEKLQRSAYPSIQISTLIIDTPVENAHSNTTQMFVKGINLIGYSRSQTGVGESCRLAARSINAVNLPFGIINYNVGNPASNTDTSWNHKEIDKPIYNVNIYHINADQMPIAFAHLGEEVFKGRYNIGYWHWELPDFPDEWKESFKLVNEIWVPSQFIMDSISKKSPVPVVKIPHGIQLTVPQGIGRRDFGLPEGSFLFLTMYDVYSYQERKNPNAVIEAFKRTFKPYDTSVGLVVKVNHSQDHHEDIRVLEEKIAGYQNIYLLPETMSRERVNALLNCTDSFISLHRSEGFGLGLAEAMFLGKAVIGTNWSANVDFMNYKNSCTVDYNLVKIGKDYGPYKAYQYWADPDVEHAGYFMKKLVSDQEYYRTIARNGQKTIRTEYSPEVVGEQIKNRLTHLGLL